MVRIYLLPSACCTCDTCPPLVRVRQCPPLHPRRRRRAPVSDQLADILQPDTSTGDCAVQYRTVQYSTVQYILYPDTSTGDCASSTLS